MGSSDILIVGVAIVGGGAIAYYTNAGGFKDWLDNVLSGNRFPAIIPLPEAEENRALANCPGCPSGQSKMVRSDGKCGCINAGGGVKVPAPSKGPPNCTPNASGYTVWKGNGCFNGKQVYGVAAAIKGVNRCDFARALFLTKYACGSKYATAYNTNAYPEQSITVS